MKKQGTFILVASMLIALAAPLSQVKAQNAQLQSTCTGNLHPFRCRRSRRFTAPSRIQDEDISLKEISVYPNPASDVIHVDFGHSIGAKRRVLIFMICWATMFGVRISMKVGPMCH